MVEKGKMKTAINSRLDKIGMFAATACAIHCLVMPLVITLLPVVGFSFLASEKAEWVLFGISAILGCISICWGYRTHKSKIVLASLATGLVILALSRISHSHDHAGHFAWLPFFGGMIIAGSHFLNFKLCKSCHACQSHETV